MNNSKTIIFIVLALLVGLIGGFFLYTPIANQIDLHAGGIVTPVSNGIWTGTEYTKPWQWSSTQWTTFVSCLHNRNVRINAELTPNSYGNMYSGPDNHTLLASCAVKAISSSKFAGSFTDTISLGSDKTQTNTMVLTITTTGDVKGTLTDGEMLPTSTTVTGFINSDGQAYLQVGKLHLSGYVALTSVSASAVTGSGASTPSTALTGTLIDTDSPTVTYVIN